MIEVVCDRVDVELVHRWLSEESYWAKGITRERCERAIENSIPFSAFDGERQIGFALVITDRATFAYLADVFVLEEYRGRGVSKQIMAAIDAHPELQGLRRWMLVTRDAHGLYEQFGFRALAAPERHMEKSAGVTAGAPHVR